MAADRAQRRTGDRDATTESGTADRAAEKTAAEAGIGTATETVRAETAGEALRLQWTA